MNKPFESPQVAVDLSNCDREPIHILGLIQDFGVLVSLSLDWMIQRVSANLAAHCGREAEDILGDPATVLFGEPAIQALRGRLQVMAVSEGSERIFALDLFGDGRPYDVALHLSDESIVVEAEPAPRDQAADPGMILKSMVSRVRRQDSLDGLFRECTRQLRAVTGFDRVMLYRFSDDHSGAVVAESAKGGLESFLGLNYPASDIPAQARALYVRNTIRSIADVGAEPVAVVPELDPHNRPLDLSLSTLRSVSPIHVEYLRNMGVGASMSVSVVIDGRLWGLFALHHYAPRRLSMALRGTAELFGQMVSLVIESRLNKERRIAEELARGLHDRFVGKIVAATPSVEAIAEFAEELREIVPCDGIAVWAKGAARTFGLCPTVEELNGLARFLNRAGSSRVYATEEIAAVHPRGEDFVGRAAGLLAIPISRSPRDYIMFFRKEMVHTVTWAGDPRTKETVFGPNGPRLSPRKSFEAWQETVRGRSLPWAEPERRAAEALRVSILEVLLRFNEETERQQTLATQRQELLIAELNHRVRNILSLIRSLVAQSRPGSASVEAFAATVGGRIQALARAHDQITDEHFSDQELAHLIETEVQAFIGGKASRVHLSGPPVAVDAAAFAALALVFHEMVTNAAKYGALSDSNGSVAVAWHVDANESCVIDWRESGGPPVAAPKRRGFGSTIIERSIPHDLGGEARVDYHLSGLRARFVLPADVFRLVDPVEADSPAYPAMPAPEHPSMTATSSLDGLKALLVEDNMIIALDAEQILLDNGAGAVFMAASVAEARRIIECEALDVALLDVNLGGETSFPLVGDLNARGVPYVFVTGYGETVDRPPEAVAAEAVKKPFSGDNLLGAIARASGRA